MLKPFTSVRLLIIFIAVSLSACQSVATKDESLYSSLGGKAGVAKIVDIFIYEIGETEQVLHHFEDTNMERFREKQIEHICVLTGGDCKYTGDEMLEVHQGMNVTEADFNAIADAMIRALDKAKISVGNRNRLLAIIAAMRREVVYK